MPESWKFPVAIPLFTDALAQEIVDQAKAEGRKPKAFDTRLRFSDAGNCARQIAYEDLEVEPEAWDGASLHRAFLGTAYHELLQPAIGRRFPGIEIEVKGELQECSDSGHADALASETVIRAVIPYWEGKRTLYELKTKSTYQHDKAVGVMRKAFKRQDPEGPGLDVILQGAMNARANDCETLVIGYVSFENYSVGLAAKIGLRNMDRFIAEWHIPREVWDPLLDREIARLNEILGTIDAGYLPDREVYDEKRPGELKVIDPEASKPAWNCDYCSHRVRCEEDGPGIVEIPVEIRKKETV